MKEIGTSMTSDAEQTTEPARECFETYPESSTHVPPRCAAPLPSLHVQSLRRREFFGGGSVITGQVAAHRKDSALPSAQVVCYSC